MSSRPRPGRVAGSIGPNGAGKTTAILLWLGMLCPGAGRVTGFGEPGLAMPWPLRQRIGYLAERTDRPDLPDLKLPELLAWQSCHFERWDHALVLAPRAAPRGGHRPSSASSTTCACPTAVA